jgi:DnaJ-domain-containing protein 1
MSDYFLLLGEPRRPWLDSELLKQKFLTLSADAHPDRVHSAAPSEKDAAQQRYTALNAAYNCLKDPKDRLRHLLELESGAKPKDIQTIPSDLMDFFMEVSQLCRQTDSFLVEKNASASPLIQVQMFERSQDWTEKLMALQKALNSRREQLVSELKILDAGWKVAERQDDAVLQRLEAIYRLFSYYARWGGQLQERIVQLAF